MANMGWRTRVGATLVAAGLAGVVLAWGHYPPHQHALEGLFSRSWPQSAASSAWATVRGLARLSVVSGVLIAGGYERAKLLDKGFLVWLAVVGVLVGVALLTPVGAWPLFTWMIVSSLWTVGSWMASSD
jgi:hypothetical protein